MSQLALFNPHSTVPVAPSPAKKRTRRARPTAVVAAPPIAPAVRVEPSLRPILFLDFDGVVAWSHPTKQAMERLRRPCVAILNTVVERTGCLVVVSSMWRLDPRTGLGFGAVQLEAWLREAGFKGEVVGITCHLPGDGVRGQEIQRRLTENEVEPTRRIAIVDDWEPMGALTPKLVRTDYDRGITMADADRLVTLLGPK